MIHTPTSFIQSSKKNTFYQIIFEQDAIFSGLKYFNSVLKDSLEDLDILWHIKDGECILKGQTCMEVFQETDRLNDIIKVISYLSGVSTLACCYTELSDHFSIIGCPLKNSPLFEWELQSLSYGRVSTSPSLPKKICYSEEDLNLQDSVIALSSEIPIKKLKTLLKKIPSYKTRGLYGSLSPLDLKKWNDLPFNVIWPQPLQGPFPRVKIKIHGNQ